MTGRHEAAERADALYLLQQQAVVCSGRGDPAHGGTVPAFWERRTLPSDERSRPPGSLNRPLGAAVFACPACGRRLPIGAQIMSQLAKAVREGELTEVDISRSAKPPRC